MKFKIALIVFAILFLSALGFGLVNRFGYTDANRDRKLIETSYTSALSDETLKMSLARLKSGDPNNDVPALLDAPNILAVRCEDWSTFRYRSMTQKVSVVKVFRSESLSFGDELEVVRSRGVSSREGKYAQPELRGRCGISFGYVNEMIPGKTYLVFLDHGIDSARDESIWYFLDNLVTAQFCYEEIPNKPVELIGEEVRVACYENIKENEFFLTSEEAIERMLVLKTSLLQKFPLEEVKKGGVR